MHEKGISSGEKVSAHMARRINTAGEGKFGQKVLSDKKAEGKRGESDRKLKET